MQAFKLRLPDALRARLDQVAAARGQSVNAEIIRRLEGSFGNADEGLGDGPDARLLHALCRAMTTAGAAAKRLQDGTDDPTGWVDNPYAYEQASKAAAHLLELLRPAGAIERPVSAGPLTDLLCAELGVHFVNALAGLTRNRGPSLRETLGPLADRLPKEES